MLDKLKEFRETLHERIKSPFIGSFMIAWSLIHWRIFILFFYEEEITISQRIEKIQEYLISKSSWDLVFYPILITLLILIGYAILNSLGLLIKLLYDNWASPYIQKAVYNKNIIEKAKYEKLKSQYTLIQKEYDTEKEAYIKAEKDYRDLKINSETFQSKSFEGKVLGDITQLLDKNVQWENYHVYPDGRIGSETFTCDFEGFILTDGTKIRVTNIKVTTNGRYLTFDKIIGDKTLNNQLIQNNKGDYYGIEDHNIVVNYRKKKIINVAIKSAMYGGNGVYFNVLKQVVEFVSNGSEIKADNDIFGDPIHGVPKTLEIVYDVNGKEEKLVISEGESAKITN